MVDENTLSEAGREQIESAKLRLDLNIKDMSIMSS